MLHKIGAIILAIAMFFGIVACSSTRQIDPNLTNSFRIEGTSWYGFCQGRNAFIWVPSHTDGEPDELEAVVYDDYRCIGKVTVPARTPDTDPDGLIDNDDD
jgi:hypothetical protein